MLAGSFTINIQLFGHELAGMVAFWWVVLWILILVFIGITILMLASEVIREWLADWYSPVRLFAIGVAGATVLWMTVWGLMAWTT